MTVTSPTYLITGYTSRTDTNPRTAVVSWQGLAARLANPRIAACSVATCAGRTCLGKLGAAWSPATIAPDRTRCDAAVTALSLLVLDVDHVATDAELCAVVERVATYRHIVHATHSDRAGDRCVRVVLPLSRPATRDEWPRVWTSAIDVLEVPADRQCGDRSRLYYAPSRPRGADYRYFVGDGNTLDVDEMLARAPAPRSTPVHEPLATSDAGDVYSALDQLDQAAVLAAISGSTAVRGEVITIGASDHVGRRRIIVDGRPTAGYVDAAGRIAHRETAPGARDGGPTVAQWCRWYGYDDREIRAMLVDLVLPLRAYAAGARRYTHRVPTPSDMRGGR